MTLLFAITAAAEPLSLGEPAPAPPPPPPSDAFSTAVALVDGLYLDPAGVRPNAMFLAAARELEQQVPWLLATEAPEGLVLRHGADPPFATLPWPTTATLATRLQALAAAVRTSGFPLDGV